MITDIEISEGSVLTLNLTSLTTADAEPKTITVQAGGTIVLGDDTYVIASGTKYKLRIRPV